MLESEPEPELESDSSPDLELDLELELELEEPEPVLMLELAVCMAVLLALFSCVAAAKRPVGGAPTRLCFCDVAPCGRPFRFCEEDSAAVWSSLKSLCGRLPSPLVELIPGIDAPGGPVFSTILSITDYTHATIMTDRIILTLACKISYP